MKGQYFSFDAIIATVIVAIATTSLVAYWFAAQSVIESRSNPLQEDAMRIAEALLSPGVPQHWSTFPMSEPFEGVYQFGLAKNHSGGLDGQKMDRLQLLANPASPSYYEATGNILRAPEGYYIAIEEVGCAMPCGSSYSIGNAAVPDDREVAVAHRGAVLDGKPYRIRVFVWN